MTAANKPYRALSTNPITRPGKVQLKPGNAAAQESEVYIAQAGKIGFKGSVKLSDDEGQVLYSTAGDVQCSG